MEFTSTHPLPATEGGASTLNEGPPLVGDVTVLANRHQ